MRFLLLVVLLALANLASAVAANTNVDARIGDGVTANKVTSATINSTENTLTIQVTAGKPRTVQFVSDDTAWIYRSSASGTDLKVAQNQTLTLTFEETTTVYFVRQSADGTLKCVPQAPTPVRQDR